MKEISAILINYNSSHFTINCIKSIVKQTSETIDYEIIIVDNASNIEDFNSLKKAVS